MSSDSEMVITPQDTISSEWSDLELIHQHGSQSLYRVKQYGRWFILKTADPSDTNAILRLQKEFQLGISLEHPNIVRMLDYGHDNRIGDYIRMEWIDGMTLSDWIATRPSKNLRLRIVTQMLEAIACLHAHQIVHRDLKPSNMMVTRNGNNLKLIDFGLSDSDDYSVFKQPAGTLSYMAPEQMMGAKADVRADIYSLGKIIAFVFPSSYERIARTCTREDASQRYPSVEAVSKAISQTHHWRTQGWWIIPVAFLIATWIGVAVHLSQPDPRYAVIHQAKQLVQQEYDQLIQLPLPESVEEWSENMNSFYRRCWAIRDSMAPTISDEALRNDFIHTMVLESGQKGIEYERLFEQKDQKGFGEFE